MANNNTQPPTGGDGSFRGRGAPHRFPNNGGRGSFGSRGNRGGGSRGGGSRGGYRGNSPVSSSSGSHAGYRTNLAVNANQSTTSNPRGYTTPALRDRNINLAQATTPRQFLSPQAHRQLSSEDYRLWREVSVRVRHLPRSLVDTWELYKLFSKYGQISYIRIEDRGNNGGAGCARIVFSTTPTEHFWSPEARPMTLTLPDGRTSSPLLFEVIQNMGQKVVSPINPAIFFDKTLDIPAAFMTFGLMTSEDMLLGMHQISATDLHPVILELDLTKGRPKIDIRFSAYPQDQPGDLKRYRLQASLQLVHSVIKCRYEDRICLVLSVQEPPKYFQQTADVEKTHTQRAVDWKEWPKMWERQTDIDNDMNACNTEPLSLVRANPIVDTGRWLTYRLDFSVNEHVSSRIDLFCLALNHHNIQHQEVSDLKLLNRSETEAWKYLDPHKASHPSDLHEMQHDLVHLDFDVRYQLEACISQHRLNEYNMKLPFFQQLAALDKTTALNLLENVADSKKMYHDPMSIFTAGELRTSRKRRAPHGCVLMHAVTITPTTLRITTPTVEVSNRVIRDLSHVEDRFIRVKFEDEDYVGRLWATAGRDNQDEVYNRIRRALKQGIDIAGRHYDLLAHGNSQFREHGAYFFSASAGKTADQIRSSLGQFEKINVVAKYAARVGQCFSTTRSIRQLPRNMKQINIKDVYGWEEGKKYCFTDGVGKVSTFVAQMIADEFGINRHSGDLPSVYQFRMGGHKGVLAVDPTLRGVTVAYRPSQSKFDTKTQGLEVIRISNFATAYLNQQIILVLNALGVPDKVFVDKMVTELERMDKAMVDQQIAVDLLTKNVDFNRVSIAMTNMIADGFMESREPFFMSLLQLWRAWRIKFLKEKAHIPVEEGAFVLGCTDETNSLRMVGDDKIPEIFIQVKDPYTKTWKAKETLCVLARNPSLHPGDVRMVKAVACEKLSHLKDVVVFPQHGDRDLANMCSGGDLDGDDYLVIWDPTLFPPKSGWNYKPMDFTPPIPKMSVDVVTKNQIIENFINYIKNDRLGTIATRHRAWADYMSKDGGIMNDRCLRLAELHSIAVDFPKSGVPAEVPDDLLMVPKWPHWMEPKYKPENQVYISKAVLGQLYDQVVRQEFRPQYDNSFDPRILNAYQLSPEILETVRGLKKDYDADIRRLMAQQGVKTEFEIWTSFVMSHNREKRDYQFAEEMGRLVGMLKTEHRDHVLQKAGIERSAGYLDGEDFAKAAPFIAAMYKVTKGEVDAAKSRGVTSSWEKLVSDDQNDIQDGNQHGDQNGSNEEVLMPLVSFPWMFADEMGRIARKDQPRPQELVVPIISAPRHRQAGGTSIFAINDYELKPLREIDVNGDIDTEHRLSRNGSTLFESSKEVSQDPDDTSARASTSERPSLASSSSSISEDEDRRHKQYNDGQNVESAGEEEGGIRGCEERNDVRGGTEGVGVEGGGVKGGDFEGLGLQGLDIESDEIQGAVEGEEDGGEEDVIDDTIDCGMESGTEGGGIEGGGIEGGGIEGGGIEGGGIEGGGIEGGEIEGGGIEGGGIEGGGIEGGGIEGGGIERVVEGEMSAWQQLEAMVKQRL